MGAITALGEGVEALWEAVLSGRSAIKPVTAFGEDWIPTGAYIDNFDAEKFVTQRKALKVMARDIQLAVAAASLALDDAGAKNAVLNRERAGVIVGSGVLNHELEELSNSVQNSMTDNELDLKKFGDEGLGLLFPLWLLKYLPNMSACHVSILFDLQGPNNTLTTGASGGLQAVGEAFRMIERGSADLMLAGGAESKLNPVGLAEYEILGVLSKAKGAEAHKSYNPFDSKADGVVVGEGAGFLVLEELEHAKKRGAKIYAEVAGFGSSSNTGREAAMRSALRDSNVKPENIDYLQASGLGIPEDDRLEISAMENVFSESISKLSVGTSKRSMGFTGFAAGALDMMVSVMAAKEGTVPSVAHIKEPLIKWNFEIAKDKPAHKNINYTMTNTFGFNGQSASIITKTFKEGRS